MRKFHLQLPGCKPLKLESSKRMMKRNQTQDPKFKIPNSGYTLIEILVGLTIIALLFGAGYINFRDFSRRQAIAGAAKKMQGDMSLTQQLAFSGQKPVDAKCDSPNLLGSYDFTIIPPSEYIILANCTGGTVVNKDVILPSDISIASVYYTGAPFNTISFKVLGQGTNIPDTRSVIYRLTQSQTNNKFDITIGSGGNIQ